MGNVVDAAGRFAKAAAEQVARDAPADVLDMPPDLSDLILTEPQYGEEVIGTLTPQEAAIYRQMLDANEAYEEASRETVANTLETGARAIRERRDESPPTMSKEQGEALGVARRRLDFLRGLFFFEVCGRLGSHAYTLGVRSRGRIVRHSPIWKQQG